MHDQDAGSRLRSLYAAAGGVRSVFSTKVEDYVASRPDYPGALFDALDTACGLHAGATVADVGAGTGLLTRGLLRKGYRVIAVEPNPEMRRAADLLLGGLEGYFSMDGCAESIPLETGSVDLATAAQAFHWFDAGRARHEFLRILAPQGQAALIRNDRAFEDPLQEAFDEIADEFGGVRREALLAHEKAQASAALFFGSTRPRQFSWPNSHCLDARGFLSLILSRSYMPDRNTPGGRAAANRVDELFKRFARNGVVEVRYQTTAVVGRPA